MPEGLVKELREIEPVALPDRDVRAGKPLILGELLRFDTLRALVRIGMLGALDLMGLFLAIYTALVVKAAIRSRISSIRCGARRTSTSRSPRS